MIWGVSPDTEDFVHPCSDYSKWVTGCVFISFSGMALSELASAAPTSGGVGDDIVYRVPPDFIGSCTTGPTLYLLTILGIFSLGLLAVSVCYLTDNLPLVNDS
jgi:amino acid transporter